MRDLMRRGLQLALAFALVAAVAGCATQAKTTGSSGTYAAPAAQSAAAEQYYFLVYPETGRLHAFGDLKTYLMFMENGEVPYTRTRIGAGPQGQTVVFGITSDDVKKNQASAAEMFFDGKAQNEGAFYGEVFKGGRYHVFGEWGDFKDYLAHGEITYTFTQIGTGPKGETVIYALNKETSKKGAPVALIAKFQALRGNK